MWLILEIFLCRGALYYESGFIPTGDGVGEVMHVGAQEEDLVSEALG